MRSPNETTGRGHDEMPSLKPEEEEAGRETPSCKSGAGVSHSAPQAEEESSGLPQGLQSGNYFLELLFL